jgi:hypothetical protein
MRNARMHVVETHRNGAFTGCIGMKLPRDVSGGHLAETLCRRWQYSRVHQSGSHIILETGEPSHRRIAIPDHSALRIGTFNSILRAVSNHKCVTRGDRRDAIRTAGDNGKRDCHLSFLWASCPFQQRCRPRWNLVGPIEQSSFAHLETGLGSAPELSKTSP